MSASSRFDLPPGALVVAREPLAGALHGELAEEGVHGLPVRHRVGREAVAEVGEGEVEATGQLAGAGDSGRPVREEALHSARRLEVAFGIHREQAPGAGDGCLMADRGQDVVQLAGVRSRVERGVSRDEREAERAGLFGEPFIARLLVADAVMPEFDGDVAMAVDIDQPFERRLAARQADQPGGVLPQLGLRSRMLTLGGAQLHGCNQLGEVLIAGPALSEQSKSSAGGDSNFSPDMCPDPGLLSGEIELRSAAEVVDIDQRHGRYLEPYGFFDNLLGRRRPGEEAETGPCVEFRYHSHCLGGRALVGVALQLRSLPAWSGPE